MNNDSLLQWLEQMFENTDSSEEKILLSSVISTCLLTKTIANCYRDHILGSDKVMSNSNIARGARAVALRQ